MRRILITGTAGFIGFHLARLLLAEGFRVQGYDGMSDYYDIRLKQRRHQILLQNPQFTATEALLEVLRFGFEERGLARIESFHLAINPASGRVMEKAGMGHPRSLDLPDRDDGKPVPGFVRHLHADEWHAHSNK
jgi:nucleoside-diphosphate-sugar epimerase